MAYSQTVDIRDATGAILGAAERKIAPGTVNKIIARSAQNFTRAHFYSLNSSRANALGGKRTNFYGQAAKATTAKAVADGALVSVTQVGIRQRIQGGVILPKKPGGYLTIPARAEAHGRRAREFKNLVVWRNKAGKPIALVEADATQVKRTKKGFKAGASTGGGVMYWLVPRVVQKPDPTVMPRLDLMRVAILEDLRIAARAKGTQGGTA